MEIVKDKDRMKIFQINTVCGIGSTGRIAVDISHVLEKAGHESCIAYGRGGAPKDVESYRIDSAWEVYAHAFFSRLTDRPGLYSTAATKRLIQKIKEYNPDIIHLHNIHGYYLNYDVLFRFLSAYNKPVVWTLHDCWPFTGHCAYFDFVHCDKWKEGCYHCPQKSSYPASCFLDRSRKNYDLKKALFTKVEKLCIVTPSHWLAGLVKESFLGKYPVKVIHNGIDLHIFRPTSSNFRRENGLEGYKIILGVASPWTPRKGLSDFIKLSKMMDDHTRIVLVGLSDRQIKKLPPHIIGIKRTNNPQELAGLYTTADVFFNPTYEDNYPTTNLESLACGTPVVTYNTGGSPESVGENGAVVDKGDIDAAYKTLVKQMDRSITNVPLDKIDKNKLFQNYISIYNSVLNHI